MSGVKQIARGTILVATALWFVLAVNTAWATGKAEHAPAVETAGQAAVETVQKTEAHAQAAVDAHAPAAAGHEVAVDSHGAGDGAHVSNSLSDKKLKELFWRLVNFAALMIILVKFGAKPIASALSGRQQQIKDDIESLDARRTAAENSFNEFEAKLDGVEKEIDTIVEKAVAQAEVEKTKILEKAEQAADDITRQAEQMIQNEITEARRVLKNDVADQAAAMAEELIKKNLTSDDQVKIIEDYLDKVGAVQ
jgi:F-type H+-transporting ATPase subunit b